MPCSQTQVTAEERITGSESSGKPEKITEGKDAGVPDRDLARRNLSNLLQSRQSSTIPATTLHDNAHGNLSNLLQTRQRLPTTGNSGAAIANTIRSTVGYTSDPSSGAMHHDEPLNSGHEDPAQTKTGDREGNSGVALKDDPVYAKYFKMLKLGLPIGAVKNAIQRDGLDPNVLDADHDAPAPSVAGDKKSQVREPVPKDTHRHTRLHWRTHCKVRSDTVWSMLGEDPDVTCLSIDESEFTRLFQAELKPLVCVANAAKSGDETAVKVINPKRANNGGILLARIKLSYDEMARAVDTM